MIYVVRDPVDRIRSHDSHRALVGTETEPIETAVFRDPSYINCSRYALQVGRYLDRFPREQLLIIKSEDLRWRRAETLRRVHRFLGVDPDVLPPTLDEESFVTRERESYPSVVWWTRRGLKHLVPPRHRWRIRRSIEPGADRPVVDQARARAAGGRRAIGIGGGDAGGSRAGARGRWTNPRHHRRATPSAPPRSSIGAVWTRRCPGRPRFTEPNPAAAR